MKKENLIIITTVSAVLLLSFFTYWSPWKKNGEIPLPPTQTQKTSLGSAGQTDSQSDWKYYINNVYGFSFRCPDKYTITETNNSSPELVIQLADSNLNKPEDKNRFLAIDIYKNLTDLPNQPERPDNLEDYLVSLPQIELTPVRVGDKDGFKTVNKEDGANIFYLQLNDNVLAISPDPTYRFFDLELINQILTTFKFRA